MDYYVNKAKELEAMGADTLCIKDMAGIMAPYDIAWLISEIKKNITIPIPLHTHYTSGMASMIYLKAIEPIGATLAGTPPDPGLNLNALFEMSEYLETIAPKYEEYLATNRMSVIDTAVLVHQVPGDMISNLVSQLKEAKALDRLNEVYAEMPNTRRGLGTPPLVPPTSQIVGVQAVLNVLLGKCKRVTNQVKDLVFVLYGKIPTPIDPEVQKLVLKTYKRGQTPVTGRAADYLEPELEEARNKIGNLAKDDFDLLIYALYPTTGEQFLE
jgi:pyruvate carboxylase subunit B